MFLSEVTDRGMRPALVKTLAFHEARLRIIAENVANLSTPGYRAKQVDRVEFQRALGEAIRARGPGSSKALVVRSGKGIDTDAEGFLRVTPTIRPADNVLFHDGTNMSIEREMADLAETQTSYDMATALLQRSYDGLKKAIRGTV